jgi:hypothetical protein
MALVYHGTPLTPRAALQAVLPGRAVCVSFYRPDSARDAEMVAPYLMYDNGAFSFWRQARNAGKEWDEEERDWRPFYTWLEDRLFAPGRWAVIPDRPGAPSQLNDALLNEWPFGRSKGAPLWHMDGPLDRLGRLCERYDRVCLGWIGEFDPATGNIRDDQKEVDFIAYHRRMEEVAGFLGNRWPVLHMMRGVAVAGRYPFDSADSTSLSQNGHRHDWKDRQYDFITGTLPEPWAGRRQYADRLEAIAA